MNEMTSSREWRKRKWKPLASAPRLDPLTTEQETGSELDHQLVSSGYIIGDGDLNGIPF